MLNQTISKKVISIYEAKEVGFVIDIVFSNNLNSVLGYKIVSDDYEGESFLSVKDISSEGDIVLIKNDDILSPYIQNSRNPIFKEVYSLQGDYFGIVQNVIWSNYEVIKICTDKTEILSQNVVFFGDILLLSEVPVKKQNYSPKKRKILTSVQTINEPIVKILDFEEKKEELQLPKRITSSTNILIGKRATANIFGLNNEIIIKHGELITEKMIIVAKKHNRINQLLFNSL